MKPSREISKSRMEQRAKSAVNAMKAIGIPSQVTRSTLNNLLKAYDNNWEYIEEENYRLLADSVFESQGEELESKRDDEVEDVCNASNDLDSCMSTMKRPGKEFFEGGRNRENNLDCGERNGKRCRKAIVEEDHNKKNELENDVSNRRKTPRKEIAQGSSGIVGVREECFRDVQIACSAKGEVSISLKCSSAVFDGKTFCMPSIEEVCKLVEDRRLALAKRIKPDLSFMSLLTEMCECALELGSKPEGGNKLEQLGMVPEQKIAPKRENNLPLNPRVGERNGNGQSKKKLKWSVPEPSSTNSNSLVVVQQQQIDLDDVERLVNPRDITNGQERHRIPLICDDEVQNEFPSFHYIRHNVIYQKASVPISLARIGDEYCCADCYGDCLKASIPCACARETGGEYAYTSEGLLKEAFLDSFIAKYRHTQKHHLHFCQICPVERIKNEAKPEKCKGHLIGTFIKECWMKCGCSRICGNRVVQRGIRCHLEVFYTSERKGWGLRSPDELPKGTFVCEYSGEILTNMELHERTACATRNKKHTYPVLLDADWAAEGILEDEDALCLDATHYGNVARFMNHRCCDANLIEIPVEIETPDHHYYHVAFFTTRKVEAKEELCWDYGIDFTDHNHPIKAFRCSCGSKRCRDRTRSKGTSAAVIVR